ncbi:MAG: hypothetical protein B7X03_03640 [Parcubacteria group bacterium 21-58-10]|nr:MAG: hypothetical protein B7X03_03640 [Parcubacteria group bacterium 21-58-10]
MVLEIYVAVTVILALLARFVPPVRTVISGTGQNSTFVTAMAHAGAAFFLGTLAIHWGAGLLASCLVLSAVFALKEFWYDLRYELDPRQTLMDSTVDYGGYLLGLALLVAVWL